MLQSSMNRFFFSTSRMAGLRMGHVHGSETALWRGLCLSVGLAVPLSVSGAPLAQGLLVQLRPGVAELADTEAAMPVVRLETPQAVRERAQAVWQRGHERRAAHVRDLAASAGVAVKAVGSAGSGLRLDMDIPDAKALDAAMRRLRLHPDVMSVEPNARLKPAQATTAQPNDPEFANQWHVQAPSQFFLSAIDMPAAWARTTGANVSVTVAVVDGGVRFDHPDLAGKLWPGHDFVSELDYANDGDGRDADASDPGDWVTLAESRTAAYSGCDVENSSWHGTAIAGLIAAASNNGLGVAGIHWGAKVLPVRVAGKCGAVLSDLLDGVRWAAGLPVAGVPANPNPARVINLSYGGSGVCGGAYQTTVSDVTTAGALLVVAAGNEATPLTRPADCAGAFAVAAVGGNGTKAAYANYGSQVALAAPGGSAVAAVPDSGLLTTRNTGLKGPESPTYANLAGSSFAAPLVAGVAGLMLSTQPALTRDDLAALLRASVRPHTVNPVLPTCQPALATQGECNCTTSACGAGLLDAGRALAAAATHVPGSTVVAPLPSLSVVTLPTASTPATDTQGGGGGALGMGWGAALWLWLAAVAWSQRRARQRP